MTPSLTWNVFSGSPLPETMDLKPVRSLPLKRTTKSPSPAQLAEASRLAVSATAAKATSRVRQVRNMGAPRWDNARAHPPVTRPAETGGERLYGPRGLSATRRAFAGCGLIDATA